MKRFLVVAWLVVTCWIDSPIAEAQQPKKSEVTLSLEEFQDIFTSARLQDAEHRASETRKRLETQYQNKLKDLENKQKQNEKERLEENQAKVFPDHFQVVKHSALGRFDSSSPTAGVEGDVVTFDLELTVRVMQSSSPKWTMVPLVNTSSTVAADWKVTLLDGTRPDYGDEESGTLIDTVADPCTMLLIRNDQQFLATNQSGLFRIEFQAYTRVAKTRNLHSMSLSNLLYPLSDFSLRIAKEKEKQNDSQTKKTTTILKDFSIQPAAAVLQVREVQPSGQSLEVFDGDAKDSGGYYTELVATLPLTAYSVQIRWTSVIVGATESKSKSERDEDLEPAASAVTKDDSQPQVTATHQALHTIEEGILRSSHTLEFQTSNREDSPLSSVSFWVHGGSVRITSVAAHALQSWAIVEADDPATSGAGKQGETKQLVKAYFKTSQLDSSGVILQVHTETDRGSSGGDESRVEETEELELPRIECRDVLRQTGHIAIIKDANVEVHEQSITPSLSRCEPSDLSSRLRLNVDRPIVLSYKYLNNPQNALVVLNVTERAAMETLEAAIDRLHYQALVTQTHTVHSMILVMQSTKLQYLRVAGLPTTSSKFTVLVNSEPVKPVRDKIDVDQDGNQTFAILVPLLVGLQTEAANQGSTLHTSVEVTYFSTLDEPLTNRKNGTLSLDPPQFDLPISLFTTHLRLPRQFTYKFSGDMGKVYDQLNTPAPEPFAYRKGKRVVRKDHKFTVLDDFWPGDEEDELSGAHKSVKIQTPRTGQSCFFQQLLVVDRRLELTAAYKKTELKPTPEPWWKRLF